MRLTSVIAAGAVLATFACSGSPSGPSDASTSGPSGSMGTMNVRLTDSPYGSARAVFVTFSEVSAQRADGGWTKLPFADGSATRTCDLKKLQNSAQDVLGTGPLTPGQYNWIRLQVQSAKIYLDAPSTSPAPCAASMAEPPGAASVFTIPSGEVKLNGTFTLTAGTATTLLLDFDGESSIEKTGNGYLMKPVVRLVSVQ